MQFRDLGAQYQALKSDIDAGIQEVIESSAFILGKPVAELENQLAAYVGRKHCIACGNGTDALQLALMVWGIGPGDAVFTSDFTYFASAGAASILGATPVLVDIDLATFNLSPEALETAIQRVLREGKLTPKVVVPVDLFGQPADYKKILPIAEKYGLKVFGNQKRRAKALAQSPACRQTTVSAASRRAQSRRPQSDTRRSVRRKSRWFQYQKTGDLQDGRSALRGRMG